MKLQLQLKIFTEAKLLQEKPIIDEKLSSIGPAAIIAPTIITLEIAFAPLLRVVEVPRLPRLCNNLLYRLECVIIIRFRLDQYFP